MKHNISEVDSASESENENDVTLIDPLLNKMAVLIKRRNSEPRLKVAPIDDMLEKARRFDTFRKYMVVAR